MADSKPQFDPNQPFDVVKPPFDPSQPHEVISGATGPSSDQQPNQLESALRGGLQGLTSGFEDEAVGGIGAGLNAVSNLDPSVEHLVQKYKELRDLERAKNEAAQKANPGTYRVADIAGAIGQGFALPVTGLVGGITKDMSALEKVGQAAKIGGLVGGISGLGSSDADLTQGNTTGAAQDTLGGAALGAATGGLLQGGVETAKGLGSLVGKGISSILNKYSPTRVITKATEKGLEGKYLGSLDQPLGELEGASKDLATKALGTRSNLQGEYDQILEDTKNNKVDLSSFLEKLQDLKDKYAKIKDPQVQQELQTIEDTIKNYTEGLPQNVDGEVQRVGGSPVLNSEDVFNLQKLVGDKAANQLETFQGKQFGKSVDTALGSEAEKAIPELPDINKRYSAVKKSLDVLGIDDSDALVKNVKTGELELSPNSLSRIQQFIKNNALDSAQRSKAQQAMNLVMDNLDAAGLNTDNLRKTIQEVGENFDIAKDISGKGLHSRLPIANIKNTAYIGNLLGYGASKTGESYSKYAPALIGGEAQQRAAEAVSQKPAFIPEDHSVSVNRQIQQGKNVYAASSDELRQVSQKLKQVPGMETKASVLEKALNDNDQTQKNAIVFSLMQNPITRKLLEVDRVK